MKRIEIAPGAFVTEIPGTQFKRGKVAVQLVVPGRREEATALALLPHIIDRRCAQIPDPIALARHLFALYGAELSSESYTAGANRVVSLGVSGLKNEFALEGEDLTAEYLALLCNLLFEPVLDGDAFDADDVRIEKEKQADYLRSEMNDKRGYCLRQARRKLYGDSALGIESAGYLEDIPAQSPAGLYQAYRSLLRTAQVEVLVCGMDARQVAAAIGERLRGMNRAPVAPAAAQPVEVPAEYRHYSEPMDTVQGKLCILLASGKPGTAHEDAVMRVANALFGGLPTSRLFMNVREKQSLCYYCATAYGYYGGTLTIDSGVDHANAGRAAKAIMKELEELQRARVTEEEMGAAKRYLRSVYQSAKDSPDALMNFAFNEWLRGTGRSLDEALAEMEAVQPDEVQAALAAFAPAVEYVITGKNGKGAQA